MHCRGCQRFKDEGEEGLENIEVRNKTGRIPDDGINLKPYRTGSTFEPFLTWKNEKFRHMLKARTAGGYMTAKLPASLSAEFTQKAPTSTSTPLQYREEPRSINTVRNLTIRLHNVPQHLQEVALQTGRRCHGHRSPFPAGCRSRTVQQTCLKSVVLSK